MARQESEEKPNLLAQLPDKVLTKMEKILGEVVGEASDHRLKHHCNGHDCSDPKGRALDVQERAAQGLRNDILNARFSTEHLSLPQ